MVSIKSFALLALATVSSAATTTNYATYPAVPKTASVNGFADPMETSGMPACAESCVAADTGVTPCPYWDTGCLCVMSNWGGPVGECVAEACAGAEVESFTSLATQVCSKAGVESPYWFIPAAASDALAAAATA